MNRGNSGHGSKEIPAATLIPMDPLHDKAVRAGRNGGRKYISCVKRLENDD